MKKSDKYLKIFSWNVNGFRALDRKGAFEESLQHNADLVLLQETKVENDQLPKDFQETLEKNGYTWFNNFSSNERKGHAGSMAIAREAPDECIKGFRGKDKHLDQQGRTITLIYNERDTAVVNCYFPNGGSKTSSLEYKLEFYPAMLRHITALKKKHKHVIVAGDWNICHHPIDIARPEANKKSIGFLPEERAWLTKFEEEGWTDLWRDENPDRADVYTWWSYRSAARERNVGWRIDYIWCNDSSTKFVKEIEVMDKVFGSDHCPVWLSIDI